MKNLITKNYNMNKIFKINQILDKMKYNNRFNIINNYNNVLKKLNN